MAPETAEVAKGGVRGAERGEVVSAVAMEEVARAAVTVEAATAVAETAVVETAGVEMVEAETAGAATAVGATATRTWKRCAPRQGSRCDSCRAGRW